MDTVCQGNHFCFPVAGKFQCFQSTHRITGKADPDDYIFFTDADKLFKNLTGAVGIYSYNILTYKIQIKSHKRSQRCTTADSNHIDASRIEDGIYGKIKSCMINRTECKLDLFYIRLQYRFKDLTLTDTPVSDFHSLDRIELIADKLFQCFLKSWVSAVSKLRGKPDDSRFTDTDNLTKLCGGQENCLIIIALHVISQTFLPFAHFPIPGINS